jgi:hypothetical protein
VCSPEVVQARTCQHCTAVKKALKNCFDDLRRILAIAPQGCAPNGLSVKELPTCSEPMKEYFCAHFGKAVAAERHAP